jgi:hypothetical protein
VDSMVDGPGLETRSSDIELHVSIIYDPGGIKRLALRPKVAFRRSWVILSMRTLDSDEYIREYL